MMKCNPVKSCSCKFCKPNQKRREALKIANKKFRKTGKHYNIIKSEEIPFVSSGYVA